MTHFHQISEKLLLELSIQITRPSHADTWKKMANAHSVKVAHSITMVKKKEIWLILFQIFQKVWLFHQCLKRLEIVIRADITITTVAVTPRTTSMTLLKAADHHQSVHSNSAPWTLSHHPSSRSQALLKWLLLEVSIQTSTWAQPQLLCNLRFKVCNSTASHLSCLLLRHLKCKCNRFTNNLWCKTIKEINRMLKTIPTKIRARTTSTVTRVTTTKTSTQDLQRRIPNIDMRRKINLDKTVPQSLAKKVTRTNLSRKSMSLSSKRATLIQRSLYLNKRPSNQPLPCNLPKLRHLSKLSTMQHLNEKLKWEIESKSEAQVLPI